VSYCCDPNATDCCSSSAWISVPVGTIIRNPIYTPVPTVTSSPSLRSPLSQTAATLTSSFLTQSITPTPSADSESLRIGLGVGLGVGLPIALVLIGLLGFLAWEMRKSNQRRSAADGMGIREWTRPPKRVLLSHAQSHELSASV
jgi:hypothetical protein